MKIHLLLLAAMAAATALTAQAQSTGTLTTPGTGSNSTAPTANSYLDATSGGASGYQTPNRYSSQQSLNAQIYLKNRGMGETSLDNPYVSGGLYDPYRLNRYLDRNPYAANSLTTATAGPPVPMQRDLEAAAGATNRLGMSSDCNNSRLGGRLLNSRNLLHKRKSRSQMAAMKDCSGAAASMVQSSVNADVFMLGSGMGSDPRILKRQYLESQQQQTPLQQLKQAQGKQQDSLRTLMQQ